MDFKAILGSLASNKKYVAVAGMAIFSILMLTFISMLPQPSLSGQAIAKTETTTTYEMAKTLCGNGNCDSGENCNVCPADCNCVQLKMSAEIKPENFLIFCQAKITYSAINSGNSDAKDVRLLMESTVPYLNKMDDHKEIYFGDFPVGMNPKINNDLLYVKYNCGNDITWINLTLIDKNGNTVRIGKEIRA
jgi:hypothetical protein